MNTRMIAATLAAVGALGAAAAGLDAQSLAAFGRAKRAASNAAAATNTHIRIEEGDSVRSASPARRRTTTPQAGERAGAPVATGGERVATGSRIPARAESTTRRSTAPAADPVGPGERSSSVAERGDRGEISLMRESFTYNADGRRDPFLSLLKTGELRPMISDLRLVAVIYDPAGGSVAIFRDLTTKEQYRVRTGQTLGRMRVARIDPKAVTFTIEEFGFSRQETLALNDTTSARSQ